MGGSESEGVVWAGGVVCVMVLQRVDERRLLSARPCRPVRQTRSLLTSQQQPASQSQQQAAASRSAGCNSAALSCYAMPKALGKRPQSPLAYKLRRLQLCYSSCRTNPRTMDLCLTSSKDSDLTHACNRQTASRLHSEHHCRSLNWPAINPCKTLRELKTTTGRSMARHEPSSKG